MHEAYDLANICYVWTPKPYILISNKEWTHILVVANYLKSVFFVINNTFIQQGHITLIKKQTF